MTAGTKRGRGGSLADLGALHRALVERRLADERAAAAAREREATETRERLLFAASVGPVVPLRRAPAARPRRDPPPLPIARQRARDDQAALRESIAGGVDSDALLETDDGLSFRRRGVGIDVVRKLRRGVWALQGEIDLHGLRRDEAHERLALYLRGALKRGLRCVRVVHGKGLGSPGREPVLKEKVKAWLVQRDEVLAFTTARPADGGSGALIVLLKPSN